MSDPHGQQLLYTAGTPLRQASAALVLVHGRGADARSIISLGQGLDVPDLALLAPQAAGFTWYPHSFLMPWEQNEPEISSGLDAVARAVERARASGLSEKRIMLLGFSQGACLTSEFAARNPARYGGVFILTGGLIGQQVTPRQHYSGSLDGCPVLLASGDPDPHIPWERVEQTAALLRDLEAEVEVVRYPGRPHTVSQDELDRVRSRATAVIQLED